MPKQKPKVFVSYSRKDQVIAETLDKSLAEKNISTWRDQRSLAGGENWPKSTAEAIALSKVLLLIWSVQAQGSHFVEFEWTTALALRKPIIPILHDNTPLPAALTALNGITSTTAEETSASILASLERLHPETAPDQEKAVLGALDSNQADTPEQALKAVRPLLQQTVHDVHGTVYQAGGDIHIASIRETEPKNRSKIDRWIKVVTLTAGLIGIPIAFLTLSDTISEKFFPKKPSSKLEGVVRTTSHAPVVGAVIKLDVLPADSTITTGGGGFAFAKVPGKPGDEVRLHVFIDGVHVWDEYAVLPGPKIISLER